MIRSLNTLRGLAAFIVVFAHYSKSSLLFNGLAGRGAGQIGVMLFFLLSGFLMAYLYLNKEFTKKNVYHYIIARVARVIPLYLLIVILSYGISKAGIFFPYRMDNTNEFFSHLLFLKGKSVFWTIAPEIYFYVLFIFLWYLFSAFRRTTVPLILACMGAGVFFNPSVIKTSFFQLPVEFHFFKVIGFFFSGMLIGLLFTKLKNSKIPQHHFFVFSLLLLPLLYPQVFEIFFHYRHDLWSDLMVLSLITFVLVCCVFFIPKTNFILNNPVGEFMGKISYSTYLLHMPILKFFKPFANQNPAFWFVVYFSVVLIVSFLSFNYFEKPTNQYLKRKLKRKIN